MFLSYLAFGKYFGFQGQQLTLLLCKNKVEVLFSTFNKTFAWNWNSGLWLEKQLVDIHR